MLSVGYCILANWIPFADKLQTKNSPDRERDFFVRAINFHFLVDGLPVKVDPEIALLSVGIHASMPILERDPQSLVRAVRFSYFSRLNLLLYPMDAEIE